MPVTPAAPQVLHLTVDESSAGQRLDNFLMRCLKGVPKTHVYRVIRSGEVRVNKGRAAADTRVKAGDDVRVPPVRVAERPAAALVPAREFSVLFEDDALLAIDKPAGVAVHGGSGVSFGVIEQIRTQRPESGFIELAHRLDRDTSGLLLLAKKRSALTTLHAMMRDGAVRKRYLALVKGHWRDAVRNVRLALHKYVDDAGERRVTVSDSGRMAHSLVRLKARWQSASLVEVELITGRTHQIRVHLAERGHPVIGDPIYGRSRGRKRALPEPIRSAVEAFPRQALHAAKLGFDHPTTSEHLDFTDDIPSDMSGLIRILETL